MAIPLFLGQDQLGNTVPVNHVKYASEYPTLPDAFDDLCEGDILFVNRPGVQDEEGCGDDWYEIDRPCVILPRNVHIIGRGGRIRQADPINNPVSPLLHITNSTNSADTRELWQEGVIVQGLRFDEGQRTEKGKVAVLVEGRKATDGTQGHTTQVHLIDLFIDGFDEYGIQIKNTWDIQIDNPLIFRCAAGIRIEKTVSETGNGVGQIRVFGGYIDQCRWCINIDETNQQQATFGQLNCFGTTFGYPSVEDPNNGGIYVGMRPEMIAVYGCHFEALNHGIIFAANVPNHAQTDIDSVITVIGCTFISMQTPGALIDTAQSDTAAITCVGNYLGPRSAGACPTFNCPTVYQGMLVAGNNKPGSGPMAWPDQGLYENLPGPLSTGENAFRVSAFNAAPAGPYADGTIIFDKSVSKLKVWQTGAWVTI